MSQMGTIVLEKPHSQRRVIFPAGWLTCTSPDCFLEGEGERERPTCLQRGLLCMRLSLLWLVVSAVGDGAQRGGQEPAQPVRAAGSHQGQTRPSIALIAP